jgi:rhomboid family GlyGly-CTERM serine protease
LSPRASSRAPDVRAWLAVCVGAAALALAAWPVSRHALDWQPALVLREPWRAWSAAGVHWSALHLAANLAGVVVVGLFGTAARLPRAAAAAWVVAWPLTHLGLLARPDLLHYGGLSGVLHAGVAVAACWLALSARGRGRTIGMAVLGGVAVKVMLEAPWGPALRIVPGWDIAIAPLAHATGAAAGAVCALCGWALTSAPLRSAR